MVLGDVLENPVVDFDCLLDFSVLPVGYRQDFPEGYVLRKTLYGLCGCRNQLLPVLQIVQLSQKG